MRSRVLETLAASRSPVCLHLPYPTILTPQRPARCVLLSPSHRRKRRPRDKELLFALRSQKVEEPAQTRSGNLRWVEIFAGWPGPVRGPYPEASLPGAGRWEPAGGPAAGTRWGWNRTPAGGPRQGWGRALDAKVSEVTSTSRGRSRREGGWPGCTARPNGRPEACSGTLPRKARK